MDNLWIRRRRRRRQLGTVPAPGGCTMNYKVVPITHGELHLPGTVVAR